MNMIKIACLITDNKDCGNVLPQEHSKNVLLYLFCNIIQLLRFLPNCEAYQHPYL